MQRIPTSHRIFFVIALLSTILLFSCKTTKQANKSYTHIDSVGYIRLDSSALKSIDTASKKEVKNEWSDVLEIEYDSAAIERTPIDPNDYTSILPKVKGKVKKITIKSNGVTILKDSSGKKEVVAVFKEQEQTTDLSKTEQTKNRVVTKPSGYGWLLWILFIALIFFLLWRRYKSIFF